MRPTIWNSLARRSHYILPIMYIIIKAMWLLVADAVDVVGCDSLLDQYNSLYERNRKLHENVQLCSDLVVELRAGREGEGGEGTRSCGGGTRRELVHNVPPCEVSDGWMSAGVTWTTMSKVWQSDGVSCVTCPVGWPVHVTFVMVLGLEDKVWREWQFDRWHCVTKKNILLGSFSVTYIGGKVKFLNTGRISSQPPLPLSFSIVFDMCRLLTSDC